MASWWQKTAATATGIAGLLGGAYYLLMRRPLPQTRGRLRLAELHEPVEIITDRYSVPHIYAHNEDDLYLAQGYIHAQYRLWQMELNRRIGSGRLAEIFGEVAIEADRFARRLGLHRAAAAAVPTLSAHAARILDAYARGVNAFINTHRQNLPIEFTLLRFTPSLWRPVDTLQWSKMMGWNLGGNWETEVVRACLVARLGPARAAQLESGYDPGHPLIIPPGVAYAGANLDMLEAYAALKQLSGFGLLGASNNWVVDGTMTTTGAPIVCNDPHLGQAAPSIWFECHLVAGEIDVVGASFPGSPFVIIGHNRHVAWGVTNAISDVEDLYIEKFNPENPHQYEFMGQWEEAKIVHEEIGVKGRREPVSEEVRVTRHGPILTGIEGNIDGHDGGQPSQLPLALRWTGLEHTDIITALSQMTLATTIDEFRQALRFWDVPAQNFVFADTHGDIGYLMAGAIPMRAQGQALLPSPGWTGTYEWTGLIPFEELPQLTNPPQHFIVTANNRVVDDSYPYYITHEWLNGYRAGRIRDLLTGRGKLSLSDMAAIQADQYSLPARQIVPHILSIAARTQLAIHARDILQTWNCHLAPESAGAAIYVTFLHKLEHIVFAAALGDDDALLKRYLGVGTTLLALMNGYASRSKPLLIRLLNERDDGWFARGALPNGPRTWTTALLSAFEAALDELQAKLGNDPARWQYGKIHRLTFGHALGMVRPLDRLFNRGPYPAGGDIDTVNMGAVLAGQPETVVTAPSFRQIVNLADLAASLSMHAPGQSGHPGSKHYDDFIKPWRSVDYHPMLFDHEMIDEQAVGKLVLTP
ncbi:MAG TPA: penicillin acylase family protein [Ktedonobacteraceae bacterium]|jgi:penicillin amidase